MSSTDSNTQRGNAALIYAQEGFTAKYVFSLLQDTYFAILFCLHSTLTEKKLVRLNIGYFLFANILDFFHIIPFLVHGFQFGQVSLEWSKFARWIQLQLPIYAYADFQAAFWATIVAVLLVLLLFIGFGVSYWYEFWGNKLLSSTIFFILTFGLQILFPAIVYLTLTPWFCDTKGESLYPILSTEVIKCFGGSNSILIAFGTLSILTVLFISYISSVVQSNMVPIPNDLTVTTGPAFKNQLTISIVFMTINKFLIGPIIGGTGGHWWESLFNLLILTALVFHLIYYLPYQIPLANRVRGGVFTCLFWMACVSFMSINVPYNQDNENRQLDYIIIAGIVPFYLLGDFLISLRLSQMAALGYALIDEFKSIEKVAQATKAAKDATKAANIASASKATGGKGKDDKKDGKDIKSKMVKAAKDVTAKVGAALDKFNKSLDANQKDKPPVEGTKSNESEEDELSRNPRLHLPKLLYEFRSNVNSIDMIGRSLWHHSDDKDNLDTARYLYEKAELAFPDRKYIKLLRVTFLTATAADPSAHLAKLDAIIKLEPSLATRYIIYKRKIEVKVLAAKVTSEDTNAKELVNYVEFQRYFAETQQYNNVAIQSIREFWMLFLQKAISFSAFNRAAKNMENQCQKTLQVYKTMLVKYPKYSALLNSYAFFLELILHNVEEANKYHRRADEQKVREAEEAKAGDGSGSIDSQGVVAIAEDGTIEQVNRTLLKIYGYTRQEIMGRNIRLLVPSPWREKHDIFLLRYRQTNVAHVIGKPQLLFGVHQNGAAFPIRLNIQERRKENGERQFIGMIFLTNLNTEFGTIIISELGIVKLITKKSLSLFGDYEASEVVGNNVNMLMIDSFAAGHDTYLKRYRDTGEARVIGTAGRNVPAKRKNNSVFPAALTVEELYIEGERFFKATLQDTSNTQGIIFIDGFGTIQNSDGGIQQLLGYRKEDIVGKNIKGIMPPPYNEYHDMYLERFRRTKVSNILRSVEGRILPAVHADGSVIQIRAIIQRADNNDGAAGAGSGMLFKGIIKRGDLSGLGANARKGFKEKYEITINKSGVIIGITRQILTMLGYPADKPIRDFIGQPIEILVPPLPDRPTQQKTVWIVRGLKNPELNFYLLMATRNYSVLPISYNLTSNIEDESILIRIRDMSELDALLTIDELGGIQAVNDDAFILLGHDPEEVIGRNIKFIQPPDVAEQHDSFLLRYKNTKVARVVGIARTVDAMHRDGSYFSTEIQVTEQIQDGNKTFIGRLRHLKIEERVSRELILKYLINLKSLQQIQQDLALSIGSTNNTNKSASSLGRVSAGKSGTQSDFSIGDRRARFQGRSNGGGSSVHSTSESGSLGQSLASTTTSSKMRAFDEKFKFIKNCTKEDPSLAKFSLLLNIILGIFLVILVVGILLINLLPSPAPYYEVLKNVLQMSVELNGQMFVARYLYLYDKPAEDMGPCAFSTGSHSAGASSPSSGAALHKRALNEPCDFIVASHNESYHHKVMAPLFELLNERIHLFAETTSEFEENYAKIRRKDEIDDFIQGQYDINQFVSGDPATPKPFELSTLFNLFALVADAGLVLDTNHEINEKTIRAYHFLLSNRYKFTGYIDSLLGLIPKAIKSSVDSVAIFHLILTILSIVLAVASIVFVVIPRLREIQTDREKILRLIVLLPKSVIYDLVYNVYAEVDLTKTEEELLQEEELLAQKREDEARSRGTISKASDGQTESEAGDEEEADDDVASGAVIDSSDITVIPDRGIKLLLIFSLGIASITIPLIIHLIWRYTYNTTLYDLIDLNTGIAILHTKTQVATWQLLGISLNCTDTEFCSKTPKVSLSNSLNDIQVAYKNALSAANSAPTVKAIFTDHISKDDAYKSPQNPLDRYVEDGFAGLPPNYHRHTTSGLSALILTIEESGQKLISSIGVNNLDPKIQNKNTFAEEDIDHFWFMFEVLNNEAETGLWTALESAVDAFDVAYASGSAGGNATYVVTIILSLGIFFVIFGNVRKNIRQETQYARNSLFMVPIHIVRETKPIVEYVETLHSVLNVT